MKETVLRFVARGVFLGVFPVIIFVSASTAEAQANYFPLSVGNTWTYSPSYGEFGNRVDSIIGEETLNGIPTYVWNRQEAPNDSYNEKKWIAKNNDDVLFYQIWGNEGLDPAVLLDPPWVIMRLEPEVGDSAVQELDSGNIHVQSTYYVESINETITVPAGTFENCVRIRGSYTITYDSTTEYEYEKIWYAPNVGPIMYRDYTSNWQSIVFSQELISYSMILDGLPGDVNGDGNIDLTDAVLSLKVLSGLPSPDLHISADVNDDGHIGMEEALYVLESNTESPVGIVTSPTGKIWMDRNLGASRVAKSATDAEAYGDLYQWGRGTDGHEKRDSVTTSTLSTEDSPGHSSFILATSSPYDWRTPQNDNLWQGVSGTNNPCPSGFRLPTETELEAERILWTSNDSAGAFASPLKLVVGGWRDYNHGTEYATDSSGAYWSSTVVGTIISRYFFIGSGNAGPSSNYRTFGYIVRCLKD